MDAMLNDLRQAIRGGGHRHRRSPEPRGGIGDRMLLEGREPAEKGREPGPAPGRCSATTSGLWA